MMNMTLSLLFAFLSITIISAQNGGSFRCPICWRSGCRVPQSSYGKTINVPNLGSMTCGDAATKAAATLFYPDECSWVQSVTLRANNPCDCPCDPPTLVQPCALCPAGQIISDPEYVLRSGDGAGFTCGFLFDNPTFISQTLCGGISSAVRAQCGCRSLMDPAQEQCKRQESDECHPGQSRCCDSGNSCVHRQAFPGKHVCSGKGNQPWTGAPYAGPPNTNTQNAPPPPVSSPTPPPVSPPTNPPVFNAPEFEDCRVAGNQCNESAGFRCIDTTSHGWRCVNTSRTGCMSSARSGATRGGASKAAGC